MPLEALEGLLETEKALKADFPIKTRVRPLEGLYVALRRHSWLFPTHELQSDDPVIWLCLVTSWTLEPSSKIECE